MTPDFFSELPELAKEHFVLLQTESSKNHIDTVQLRLSGYSDVMHLMADIVKVCILAIGDGETHGNANIPSPESNISGVLGILLDLARMKRLNCLTSYAGK